MYNQSALSPFFIPLIIVTTFKVPYPLYGENPHIGDLPRENDAFPYGQKRSSR